MKQKGLSDEVINECLADYEDESIDDEMTELIISKYGSEDLTDMKIKARVTRFFASRGFDFSKIDSALRRAIEQIENGE